MHPHLLNLGLACFNDIADDINADDDNADYNNSDYDNAYDDNDENADNDDDDNDGPWNNIIVPARPRTGRKCYAEC